MEPLPYMPLHNSDPQFSMEPLPYEPLPPLVSWRTSGWYWRTGPCSPTLFRLQDDSELIPDVFSLNKKLDFFPNVKELVRIPQFLLLVVLPALPL